jgi:pyruvate/2-oxoglutarate dehydrogenase complex dihydrolipoamide dehydrogenase (E3) component
MSKDVLKYDAIIIGSGQGGNPLASKLAGRGERVALIESSFLGGTCVNTGCTPTKTMVASAQVAHYARYADRWGVRANNVSVDLPAILKRKDEVVMRSRSGWERSVDQDRQPRWFRGRAQFTGPKRIEVDGETLEGTRVFIDTGSTPTIPDLEGINSVPYLTNESILKQNVLPETLIVLGGGYVGLEFAQMFRRFGSEVIVVQRKAQILPSEDEEVAAGLQKALEAEGIRFHLNARATKVQGTAGNLTLTLETGGEASVVTGSHLLVAVGRSPQTKDLQLERTGVETDAKGYIQVNERLETTAPDIWAMGDVTGHPAFTHFSYNDFQIIYANVYENGKLSTRTRILQYAVFTDPALGRVGVTEREARAQGKKIKVGKIEMARVARAVERGETAGLMKIVVDAESDKVLGAAILSSEGGEVVQILHTLMLADKPHTLLKEGIFIHPTFAEGFFTLMNRVQPVN